MSAWETIHVDELDAVPLFHGLTWRPVRSRFGIRAFGINAYESDAPGGLIVEEHSEIGGGAGGHEELYVVLRGRATFTIDGAESDAPAGTLVFIRDPAVQRSAVAEEQGTLVLAIGGEPGAPFEVSAWESYFAALPDFRAERWESAMEKISAGLLERPDHPSLLYNLACAEARGGHADDAIGHLTAAIAGEPGFREQAAEDPDFDGIRARPDFPASG